MGGRGSGFLGAGGEDHGGGETVDTQSRDVDLITAVGGKLEREAHEHIVITLYRPR